MSFPKKYVVYSPPVQNRRSHGKVVREVLGKKPLAAPNTKPQCGFFVQAGPGGGLESMEPRFYRKDDEDGLRELGDEVDFYRIARCATRQETKCTSFRDV
jgi:hypothetical protein